MTRSVTAFTLRFFGIAQNDFTTFAIDNVMIAATPGSVVVTPIIPEQTPDLDETVNRPDLMVEHGLALSRTVQAGAAITFYPRTTNVGTASAPSTTIRIYRHEQETTTPRVGGVEETRTARSAALAPDRSAITVAHATAPSTAGVHYYYLCLDHVTNETVTNNNCTQTPATVSIEQTATDPGQEEVPETTPTTAPDVTVTETVATAPSAIAGDTISIQATITNIGSAAADATTIHVYRHTHKTINPLGGGGTQEANTATTPTLAPNKSVQVTSTHQAPSVLEATTYYYYICLAPLSGEQTTDNNCSSTPAIITVRPKREDPGPPYESCLDVPTRSIPMGGDIVHVQKTGYSYASSCGTITLGGLETETGVHGFVVSAHVVVPKNPDDVKDFTNTNTLTGHSKDRTFYTLQHFLGKVYRMPRLRKMQSEAGSYNLLPADAAFVAYPHPKTPGCSLTWSGDGEEFCLDVGAGEYIERVVPLTVRGADGATHTVIGSKEATDGLAVRFFGAKTGVPKENVVEGTKALSYKTGYNNYINLAPGSGAIGGDSGAPVYTAPDATGKVHIVGIVDATFFQQGKSAGITFFSWSDVEEELDLKPISAPDGLTEEDEADLAGLFSAFD